MKRLLPILLAVTLLFCGCAKPGKTETQPSATEETSAPTETEAGKVTVPTVPDESTAAPTEKEEAPYHNPLTGEPMEAPLETRPVAVVINNIVYALPHHGTEQADIVYEILAEANITRCLGIFSDASDVAKVGSIRSARTYLISLATSYNALLVHAGASCFASDDLAYTGYDHLDGGYYPEYFYRDQDRLNNGYALEHTLFVSGPDIYECAQKHDVDMSVAEDREYGLHFAEDGTPDGEKAEQITVDFLSGSKTTTMTYNAEKGMYYGTEYGLDFVDGNSDDLVGFKNVFVIHAETWTKDDGYHRAADLTGEGDGWYACGGKIIPIRWHRDGDSEPFTYTLADGTPLEQGIGRSYIAVVPISGQVDYQ